MSTTGESNSRGKGALKDGSALFIHASGRQRANLKLIDSLGVDGLEGVAFPLLGDAQLDEVMLAASCKTSIRTSWNVIQWFRNAWKEFSQ